MADKFKLMIIVLLLGAVYSPIFPALTEAWLSNSNNSHGLLVPFVAIYIVWGLRDTLAKTLLMRSSWGLVMLSFSLLLYLFSLAGDTAFTARLMMICSVAGVVWYLYGSKVMKVLAFPLAFLLFMVPVPDSILGLVSFPLQLLATQISAGFIKACSIPVVREGNMLYFVGTQLEVAEACSGIRSIISLFMLSLLFVYFSPKGTLRKSIILVSAIPIALMANILRVSGTGILAHHYGERVAKGFLHDFSGLAVFLFGVLMMFSLFLVLNKLLGDQATQPARADDER